MKKKSSVYIEKSIYLFVLFFAVAAFGAEHGEGHASGHGAGLDEQTIKTIIYQAINVGALIAGLIYFLRAPVKSYFQNKKVVYMQAAQKAQASRQAAENEKMQIEVRLNKLESNADESLSRAKADAVELRKQMLLEAEAISLRIKEEARLTAKLEVERAKNHLREQMIEQAVEMSRGQMNKVTNEDHQRLQGNFISNIQVVQP